MGQMKSNLSLWAKKNANTVPLRLFMGGVTMVRSLVLELKKQKHKERTTLLRTRATQIHATSLLYVGELTFPRTGQSAFRPFHAVA